MVDISAIAHALTSLKAAKDIAEAMAGIRDNAAFQGKLIEFQSKIIDANNAAFSAQEERSSLLDRIRQLENQVSDFRAWEKEKKRYDLKQVSHVGTTAYVLKAEEQGSDAPHCICVACYEQGQKGLLQPTQMETMRRRTWQCARCKATSIVEWPLPGYNAM